MEKWGIEVAVAKIWAKIAREWSTWKEKLRIWKRLRAHKMADRKFVGDAMNEIYLRSHSRWMAYGIWHICLCACILFFLCCISRRFFPRSVSPFADWVEENMANDRNTCTNIRVCIYRIVWPYMKISVDKQPERAGMPARAYVCSDYMVFWHKSVLEHRAGFHLKYSRTRMLKWKWDNPLPKRTNAVGKTGHFHWNHYVYWKYNIPSLPNVECSSPSPLPLAPELMQIYAATDSQSLMVSDSILNTNSDSEHKYVILWRIWQGQNTHESSLNTTIQLHTISQSAEFFLPILPRKKNCPTSFPFPFRLRRCVL